MNVWLIAELVVVAALAVAWTLRARLAGHFQRVSLPLTVALLLLCLAQWLMEGAGPWTLALGTLAAALMVYAAVREFRPAAAAISDD